MAIPNNEQTQLLVANFLKLSSKNKRLAIDGVHQLLLYQLGEKMDVGYFDERARFSPMSTPEIVHLFEDGRITAERAILYIQANQDKVPQQILKKQSKDRIKKSLKT